MTKTAFRSRKDYEQENREYMLSIIDPQSDSELTIHIPKKIDSEGLIEKCPATLGFQNVTRIEHPDYQSEYLKLSNDASDQIPYAQRLKSYFQITEFVRTAIENFYGKTVLNRSTPSTPCTINLPFPGQYDLNDPLRFIEAAGGEYLVESCTVQVRENEINLKLSKSSPAELIRATREKLQILRNPSFAKFLR